MPKKANRKAIEISISTFFFVLAGFFQYYDIYLPPFYARTFSFLANVIFLLLIFLWGKSIRQRIIQKGIRRKLVIIAILLFFWLFIRFIKYNIFARKDTISRYLWYMYYIPQCLVPPLSLIAMMELTRKKKENLSKLIYLILVPAIVLILLILTNDFHQLAFAFKATEENSVAEYSHQIVYYLAIGWIIIMTFLSLVTLILKCSISVCKRKIWIPLLVFFVTTAACILCFIYTTQSYKVPELLSFSFILLIETCIFIGLIPSNDNYLLYSEISSLPFVITDKELTPIINHLDDTDITKEQYKESMTKGPLFLNENIRLSNQDISGGHIFYIENLSSITKMVHELSSKNELLSEEKELIAYENELKEKKTKLQQKNQLYDNVFSIVSSDLLQLKELLENTDKNSKDYTKNLKKACVYLSYIKRRRNLEILHSQKEKIDIQEIVLSINESLLYLNECNITASLINEAKGEYDGNECILLYEFFQYYLKTCFDSLNELLIRIDSDKDRLSLRIISNVTDISFDRFDKEKLNQYRETLSSFMEDNLFYTVVSFEKGGNTE